MATRGYFHINDSYRRRDGSGTDSRRGLYFPVSAVLSVALLITMRIIYGYRVSTVLPVGDSGHLATAAYTGGVAHPPGYPLFTMIGHFFTHLGFRSPTDEFDAGVFDVAFRMNMMSLWFGVLTVLVVYFIIARVLKNPFAAFLGAFLFGVSATFMTQSLIGEVYSMHAFLCALILYVAVLINEKPTSGRIVFMSFLFGLGLAHHTLILALLVPVLLFVALTFFSKKVWFRRSLMWGILLLFIIGWLPNLYLPIASAKDPYMDWGDPDSIGNFFKVITRSEYRAIKASISEYETAVGFSGVARFYNGLLLKGFGHLFVWLGYIGMLIALVRGKRYGLLLALAYAFMTIPIFFYFRDIADYELFYLEPYYVAAHAVFGIFLGYFFYFAFETVPRIASKRAARFVFSLVMFIIFFSFTISSYRANSAPISMRDHTIGARYSYDVMKNLPENAILIVFEDHIIPFIYLQQVAEMRQDVVVLQYESIMQTDTWFWNSTAEMHPNLVIPPQNDGELAGLINIYIDQLHISNPGRPMYFMSLPFGYTPSMRSISFIPAGLLYRYATEEEYAQSAAFDYYLSRNLDDVVLNFTTENLDTYETQLLSYYVTAYYNMGVNMLKDDNLKDVAKNYLIKAYKLMPDGPMGNVRPTAGILAEIYMEEGDWLSAHDVLKGMLEKNEDADSVYYYGDAAALVRLKRFAEARLVLDEALKRDPENQFLLYLMRYLDKPDEELYNDTGQPDLPDPFALDSISDDSQTN